MAIDLDLSKYITGITVESAYLPALDMVNPFGAGPPNPLLQALKPKITIRTTLGDKVLTPYGDPGPSRWPVIRTALVLGGLGFAAWRVLR